MITFNRNIVFVRLLKHDRMQRCKVFADCLLLDRHKLYFLLFIAMTWLQARHAIKPEFLNCRRLTVQILYAIGLLHALHVLYMLVPAEPCLFALVST